MTWKMGRSSLIVCKYMDLRLTLPQILDLADRYPGPNQFISWETIYFLPTETFPLRTKFLCYILKYKWPDFSSCLSGAGTFIPDCELIYLFPSVLLLLSEAVVNNLISSTILQARLNWRFSHSEQYIFYIFLLLRVRDSKVLNLSACQRK